MLERETCEMDLEIKNDTIDQVLDATRRCPQYLILRLPDQVVFNDVVVHHLT